MHLTNYSINKTNAEYTNPTEDEILLDNQGSKRTLQSLYDTLASDERGIDVDEIKASITVAVG